MFERAVKKAAQDVAFAFVKKGIATEQQAKQVLEETKKQE